MDDHEVLVVHGPGDVLRAFVAGFLAGAGVDPGAVLFGADLPLSDRSLADRLRHLVAGGRREMLLADDRVAAGLASALEAAGGIDLRLEARARLLGASFGFAAETPSREAAARFRLTLEELPDGVALFDEEFEESDPESHGVELYAPAHEYTLRAKGRVSGRLHGVLALHRRLGETDFVRVDHLELHEAPVGADG